MFSEIAASPLVILFELIAMMLFAAPFINKLRYRSTVSQYEWIVLTVNRDATIPFYSSFFALFTYISFILFFMINK